MKVKLTEICTPKQWKTIPTNALLEEGYPVYGANGIIGYYDEYNHEEPVIAITCRGATCGTINLTVPKAYITGNAMCLDNVCADVLPDYLYYCLLHYNFNNIISGSAQPQITRQGLAKVEIELHPIIEQGKIINSLRKSKAIINARQSQLQKLDDLVKARFVEMFGGIHDSSLYPYVPVKELTHVISGGTPSRDVLEYWRDGTIPWVKTTELQNKIITEVDEHITSKGLAASSAKIVPPNTTLIAMYGQGKTRGMTGYLGISASTNQACACILPSPEINSVYIWKYFELSYDKLRNMAKGGNQPNLNGNMIKNFPVLVPPIKRQEEYVQFVNQVDKSKVAVQKSLDEAQLMFDSLMQQYFG